MNIADTFIEFDKNEIVTYDLFADSYFDKLQKTNIGADTCKLSLEELCIFNLPNININELIDRCGLNKNKIIPF